MTRRRDIHPPDSLSEAAQGYLLALRSIAGTHVPVMTAALARRLGVSTQAASEMVGRLVHDGLVRVSPTRELSLTDAGLEAADTIFRRHSLLEWLLTRVIGLSWAHSDEEAMRLQSALSPRVEARIDDLLGHPTTCPHGNPIDAHAARTRPVGIPLSETRPNTEVTVYRITEEAEEDTDLLTFLEQEGLVPGALVTILDVSRGRESITFEGPHGQNALGLRPAGLIRVIEGRADPSLFHQVPLITFGSDGPDGLGHDRPDSAEQTATSSTSRH